MQNPPTGTSDGTGWPRNMEASSKVQTVPACIVQGQSLGDPATTGLREGYLPAGTIIVPDTDISGDACYVVMDTARLDTGGTGEQDEAKSLVLFEDVFNLDEADQYAAVLIKGTWTDHDRLRYKGTALTKAQKAQFQRLTEWWGSW